MKSRLIFGAMALGLACSAVARAAAQADPAAGQTVFNQKCASCHPVTPDLAHGLLGPNLTGVAGRAAATLAGWEFSPALKDAKLVWTDENLSKWLTDSAGFVAGAKMDLKVPNRFEREDLIAYLKTLKAK
jgi:cytochrome c